MNEQLFHVFDELESTNSKAKEFINNNSAQEGMLIQATFQTAGKGQLDAVWESRKGKNLLLSCILFPGFLPIQKQFYLNRVAALAVSDFLCLHIADDIQIKWPNDVLVNKEKIAGILIENSVQGEKIESCIVGIGININQTKFNNYIPSATSLYNLTYREHDISHCANMFYRCLMNRYKQLKEGMQKILLVDFNQLLYQKGIWADYLIKGNQTTGRINEVNDNGGLIMEIKGKGVMELGNKEVQYLFN